MNRLASLLVVCGLLVVAAGAVPVGAEHDSEVDYTVVPHDRQPGIGDATYEQHSISPLSFEYLDYIRSTWEDGGFTGCGPSNNEAFGIDRDNDASGTKTDHSLTQHVKESKVGEDVFLADFYDRDDAIGSSTYLNEGDEFVSLTADCFDNPEEPGWYQIQATVAGTLENGTYVEATAVSHYFYVCDCANEQEARQQLGPPPSEPTPTPTPTPTAEPTPTRTPPDEGTPFPSPTPTPTPEQETATPEPATEENTQPATEADASNDSGDTSGGSGEADAATPTPTSGNWSSYVRETPTVGSGPGFGSLVTLVALLAAALVAVRRR